MEGPGHPLPGSHLPRKSPSHLPPVTAPNTGEGRAEVGIWGPFPLLGRETDTLTSGGWVSMSWIFWLPVCTTGAVGEGRRGGPPSS